uniref:Uncharacterized protein n=1 Tax=Calidris pygmaea TaxID=425635 RepID=A0A8C3J4X3_9CHAR
MPVRSRYRCRPRRGRAARSRHRPRAIYPSPRRYPAPLPVPMAAAVAADRCPAAGDEQRPDGGGTTSTNTGGGTGNNGTGGSSSSGGGSSSSPGSLELAAARRRLVAAEGRRRAAAELEGRVRQVHCALRHAELRLAARAEALGRLGAGVAQAQLALAAHNQRLQKGLRRRPRGLGPDSIIPSPLGSASRAPPGARSFAGHSLSIRHLWANSIPRPLAEPPTRSGSGGCVCVCLALPHQAFAVAFPGKRRGGLHESLPPAAKPLTHCPYLFSIIKKKKTKTT